MKLAQLTDLHLTGTIGTDASYQKFLACLHSAMSHHPDFLLLTGDLVNNGDSDGYDWLFDQLNQTALPYACLAGNHDVTLELGYELPYEQRRFLPIKKDTRLIDRQLITLGTWQLICLNSAVYGKEFGQLCDDTLAWLEHTLQNNQTPTLLAMHHHAIKIGSKWIDRLMLKNADALFSLLSRHSHCRHLICGHVHQAQILQANIKQHTFTLFTSPATSRQFLPLSDNFALDEQGMGYRMMNLCSLGKISSDIYRVVWDTDTL